MVRSISEVRIRRVIVITCCLIASCSTMTEVSSEEKPGKTEITEMAGEGETPRAIHTEPVTQVPDTSTPTHSFDLPTNLVNPEDLVYVGAFRLPETADEFGWGYSGYAMTYFPQGDPQGQKDSYPGSLYVLGHDHTQYVGEIDIPTPVISDAKDSAELPTASTLQPLADITQGMFGELEIPRAGLAYLPPQSSQTTGKLYFCWGQHFQFEQVPSHGWSELDLAEPNPAGPWSVGQYTNYVTNDYLFEIPQAWADVYAPGLRLATGRFRDGSWGGLGPALLAIGPWNEGNPPESNSILQQVIPLLLYGEPIPGNPEIDVSGGYQMNSYSEPDEWSGGAWLTAGDKSALILVGTKAVGRSWYGFSNGVEYPISGDEDEEYPEVPAWPHNERGWWSDEISAQILFFDPSELALVAQGEMETWEPQPYATLKLGDYLFDPGFDYERAKRYLLGAAAFDRDNGIIYIVERMADEGERSLIHAFRIAH